MQFDVVVSAFSLSELPSKAHRTEVVQTLWRKTSHFLILVENGTKAGHCLLMDARDLVLKGKEKSPLDPRPGFVFAPVSITSTFPSTQRCEFACGQEK